MVVNMNRSLLSIVIRYSLSLKEVEPVCVILLLVCNSLSIKVFPVSSLSIEAEWNEVDAVAYSSIIYGRSLVRHEHHRLNSGFRARIRNGNYYCVGMSTVSCRRWIQYRSPALLRCLVSGVHHLCILSFQRAVSAKLKRFKRYRKGLTKVLSAQTKTDVNTLMTSLQVPEQPSLQPSSPQAPVWALQQASRLQSGPERAPRQAFGDLAGFCWQPLTNARENIRNSEGMRTVIFSWTLRPPQSSVCG